MQKHISYGAFTVFLILAAAVGAGSVLLLSAVNPGTFTAFRSSQSQSPSVPSVTTAAPESGSAGTIFQATPTTYLEADITNAFTGAKLEFDVLGYTTNVEGYKLFLAFGVDNPALFGSEEDFISGANDNAGFENAFQASINALVNSMKTSLNVDEVRFTEEFMSQWTDVGGGNVASLSASIVGANDTVHLAGFWQNFREKWRSFWGNATSVLRDWWSRQQCRWKTAFNTGYTGSCPE